MNTSLLSPALLAKHAALLDYLRGLSSVAVAFSGGVDSTYLLYAAQEALGDGVIALTARSASFPVREMREAEDFCQARGIPQYFVEIREMEIPGFADNPPDRCYLCKRVIFSTLIAKGVEKQRAAVCEGSNVDDEGDYRPGMRAIAELGVHSPLRTVRLTKAEIRTLSQAAGLPTWKKPSFACLATRFVYGETISKEKLKRVELAEELLHQLGFEQCRVRVHGALARIEVEAAEIERLMTVRERVNGYLRELGFQYVSVDLGGYQTGSMNRDIIRNS